MAMVVTVHADIALLTMTVQVAAWSDYPRMSKRPHEEGRRRRILPGVGERQRRPDLLYWPGESKTRTREPGVSRAERVADTAADRWT